MKTQVIIEVMDELIQCWLERFTMEDIRADVEKVQLLVEVRNFLIEQKIEPSETVRGFYCGVFVREQFGSAPSRETR